MTINLNNNDILLTSIPRDYYVNLSSYKTSIKDKLTHSGIYGIDESVKTVEDLLDIDISYYIRLNFSTLVKLIDEVGGIDVNSDVSFTTKNGITGVSFKKGINHLNGEKALAYARDRKSFIEGDRKRGEHQEQIIEALITKITSSKVLLTSYNKVLNNLSSSFETNMDEKIIKEVIKKQLDDMNDWNIKTYNLNGNGKYANTYSMPEYNLYVVDPDYNTVKKAHELIKSIKNNKKLSDLM